MPSQKPTTAGTKAHGPMPEACSMAGTSRLQMEAATMTPAAKPVSARCTCRFSAFFIKNTHADPAVVPKNGISRPQIMPFITKERPFIRLKIRLI